MPNASRAARAQGAVDLAAVARFLRGLAGRVERDPAFAQQIAALLLEAGLLPDAAPAPPRRRAAKPTVVLPRADDAAEPAILDPFALLRAHGDDALRARLRTLSVQELHAIIRGHRLDPARISARWTTTARLVELIVAQVRARADHGTAFARV